MSYYLRTHIRLRSVQERDDNLDWTYRTGIHPQFECLGIQCDCAVVFIEKEFLRPGEETDARIQLTLPELFENKIKRGDPFALKVGARVIGEGTVLSIDSSNT